MLESFGILLGLCALAGSLDRLRQINWHTTRKLVVAFYLAAALWSLGILYALFSTGIKWYQLLGIGAVLFALWGGRLRWRNGPPEEIISRPFH